MLRRFISASAGGVAVLTAIALPVLFGFTSLGVEVGHWYLMQRQMQGATDAAAISATAEYIAAGQTGTTYRTIGVSFASQNGMTIAASNVCLITSTGNNCDASHPLPILCATPPCVVVDSAQTQSAMFLPVSEPTIRARAVVSVHAVTTTIPGNGCVLGLNPAAVPAAVDIEGNGGVTATNCTIASNSKPLSLHLPTGGQSPGLTASGLVLAQTAAFICTAAVKCSVPVGSITLNKPTADPYATRHFDAPPPGSSCTNFTNGANNAGGTAATPKCYNGGTASGSTIFNPYTVFNGALTTSGTVTFRGVASTPGLYVFDGGVNFGGTTTLGAGIYYVRGSNGLTFANNSTTCGVSSSTADTTCPLSATANGGVTFVMTSSPTKGVQGSVTATQGTVELAAFCTNASCSTKSTQIGTSDTSGLVFFADPATSNGGMSLNGKTTWKIEGTIYFPKQTVATAGQATFTPTACTQLVAYYISVSGLGTFSNGCLPFGGTGIGGGISTTYTPRLSQ